MPSPNTSRLNARTIADLVSTISATIQHPTTENPQMAIAMLVPLVDRLLTFIDCLSLMTEDDDDDQGNPVAPTSPPSPPSPPGLTAVEAGDPYSQVICACERFIGSPIALGLEALIRDRTPEAVVQSLMSAQADPRWRKGALKANLLAIAIQEGHSPKLNLS